MVSLHLPDNSGVTLRMLAAVAHLAIDDAIIEREFQRYMDTAALLEVAEDASDPAPEAPDAPEAPEGDALHTSDDR